MQTEQKWKHDSGWVLTKEYDDSYTLQDPTGGYCIVDASALEIESVQELLGGAGFGQRSSQEVTSK